MMCVTGRQGEGESRKNTFSCVKEKMKQEGGESLSQPGKPMGPDKCVLFHALPAQGHFSPAEARRLP